MNEKQLSKIKEILGRDILSIYHYPMPYGSNIVVFILSKIEYKKMDKARSILKKSPFIILKESDLLEGRDVFALDFLHMRNTGEVVFKDDLFSGMRIERKHVRTKLEFEIRNKLIFFREQFILTHDQQRLLHLVLPTFDMFLEGVMFLLKRKRTGSFIKDVEIVEEKFNIVLRIFKKLHDFHHERELVNKKNINRYSQIINDELVVLLKAVNDFEL